MVGGLELIALGSRSVLVRLVSRVVVRDQVRENVVVLSLVVVNC